MGRNVMTKEKAIEIAKDAAALEYIDYDADYSGFWTVWEAETGNEDDDIAISINKRERKDESLYYSIFISDIKDVLEFEDIQGKYIYTEGNTEEELVEAIMNVARRVERFMGTI